jgi:hypothetical protein
MVPFLDQQIATEAVYNGAGLFNIYCQILAWSQESATVSTPIYVNVYKAGCSDMRFGGLLDKAYLLTSADADFPDFELHCNPRDDFSDDFEPIGPKMTGYEQDRLIFGEENVSLRDYLKRYWPHYGFSGSNTVQLIDFNQNIHGRYMYGLDMFSCFFRFWCGSVRVKYFSSSSDAIGGGVSFLSNMVVCANTSFAQPLYQGVGVNNPIDNTVSVDIPFMSPVLFDTTGTTQLSPRVFRYESTNTGYLFKAAGDDFSLMWLVLPPPGSIANPLTTGGNGYGTYGFSQFFAEG